MSYIVYTKQYEHQMNNLFHHSLIKIIVLHHLNQLNIAQETFIENDAFNTPRPQPARPIPPPTLVSQRQTGSSSKATVKEVKTYHMGPRQVFSPHIVEGALPSSSAKQVHQDEQQEETIVHGKEDLHEEERDFELMDLDDQDDQEALKLIIKEKYAMIK